MSDYFASSSSDKTVYIGGLNDKITRTEIEDIFSPYGRLKKVFIARNPPGELFFVFQ